MSLFETVNFYNLWKNNKTGGGINSMNRKKI